MYEMDEVLVSFVVRNEAWPIGARSLLVFALGVAVVDTERVGVKL